MSHWLRLFMSFWLDRRSTQKKREQFHENAKREITRRETDKTGKLFYLSKERLVWAAVLLYCIYARHWKDWIGLMVHLTRMMLLITNATSPSSTVCLKLPIMVDLVYPLPLLSCFFLFLAHSLFRRQKWISHSLSITTRHKHAIIPKKTKRNEPCPEFGVVRYVWSDVMWKSVPSRVWGWVLRLPGLINSRSTPSFILG